MTEAPDFLKLADGKSFDQPTLKPDGSTQGFKARKSPREGLFTGKTEPTLSAIGIVTITFDTTGVTGRAMFFLFSFLKLKLV